MAVGFSGHFIAFLHDLNIPFPESLSSAPYELIDGRLVHAGGIVNLPAIIITVILTAVLMIGMQQSGWMNNFLVVTKVIILTGVIVFGFYYISFHWEEAKDNWDPFIPPNTGKFGEFGLSGILKGSAIIFFAYIGFDCVSCSAGEALNPQRDMPIGILGSLAICTVIFVSLCLALTGMVNYTELNNDAPVIYALLKCGAPPVFRIVVEIAALSGLASVILVSLMGQPRIFYSMARAKLLPPAFALIHPKFRTPWFSQLITGICACIIAAFLPITVLGELVSIGTLFAFVIICSSVIILRHTQPTRHRPFRTPWVPLVPICGILISVAQMASLPYGTWLRLLIWMVIGLFVYFFYSRHHSKLNPHNFFTPAPSLVALDTIVPASSQSLEEEDVDVIVVDSLSPSQPSVNTVDDGSFSKQSDADNVPL